MCFTKLENVNLSDVLEQETKTEWDAEWELLENEIQVILNFKPISTPKPKFAKKNCFKIFVYFLKLVTNRSNKLF